MPKEFITKKQKLVQVPCYVKQEDLDFAEKLALKYDCSRNEAVRSLLELGISELKKGLKEVG